MIEKHPLILDHGLLLSPFKPVKNGKRDGIMKFVSGPLNLLINQRHEMEILSCTTLQDPLEMSL